MITRNRKSKSEKINTARRLLSGECVRDVKVFMAIERNGVMTCDDPDWPDNVQPDDVVFEIVIHKTTTDDQES